MCGTSQNENLSKAFCENIGRDQGLSASRCVRVALCPCHSVLSVTVQSASEFRRHGRWMCWPAAVGAAWRPDQEAGNCLHGNVHFAVSVVSCLATGLEVSDES